MRGAIVYSSKTGNTKKIAETIKSIDPERFELFSVEDNPDPDIFDFIFMGFWVDKGTADTKAIEFMKKIKSKKVAVFMTLGAYPESDHARSSLEKGLENLGESCTVIDKFVCQGAIDPKLISWMEKLPKEHPHAPDKARRKRWLDASTKPDNDDFKRAKEFAENVIGNV